MSAQLAFAALACLPPTLQAKACAHVAAHPTDDLGELVSELYIAAAELAASDDVVFARARSRLRRQTQDPAHYGAALDIERDDIEATSESTALRYRDYVSDLARERRVTRRRAQQLVRKAIERARRGDLFFAAAVGEEVAA